MTLLSIRQLTTLARPTHPGEHPLEGFDFDLAPGARVALVGPREQGPGRLFAILAEAKQRRSGVVGGTIWLELPGEGRLTLWRLLAKQPQAILSLDRSEAQNAADQIADTAPKLVLLEDPMIADPLLWMGFVDGLQRALKAAGTALLFRTSDLVRAAELCDRAAVLYAGRVVEDGPAEQLRDRPRHHLTAALGKCLPEAVPAKRAFPLPPGTAPLPSAVPKGCPFHPRCGSAMAGCYIERPELAGRDHRFACHLPLGAGP